MSTRRGHSTFTIVVHVTQVLLPAVVSKHGQEVEKAEKWGEANNTAANQKAACSWMVLPVQNVVNVGFAIGTRTVKGQDVYDIEKHVDKPT